MTRLLFTTPRLRCRQWAAEDLDVIHAVYSDPEAMRWVGDGQPISRTACEHWLEVTWANYSERGYGMFALEGIDSGAIIGFCGLVHPGGQVEPEVKYALLRSAWGQGLASEAIPALLAYGYARHGLDRIIATVAPENLPSQRVLLKAGMRLVKQRRDESGALDHVYAWLAPGTRTATGQKP
ncbi:GNAT family N-acetyltransferase [Pseudomonas tohonis]|nr:hypothetical protein L682_16860 [Pseudomonas alcaligenes OT 69]MDN4146771.1 GNAT family N-acetyltransferase [Pseudomonas tohonis]